MSQIALGLEKNGYNVCVLADHKQSEANDEQSFDIKQPYQVIRVRGIKPFRKKRKLKIFRGLLNREPIAIFNDTWKSLESILPALPVPIKVFCLAHGNDVIFNSKKAKRIIHSFQHVDVVIAVSRFTKNLVLRYINMPVVVIHNGASITTHTVRPKGFAENKYPHFLTLSRLEPRKGHDSILYSLVKLKRIYPNLHYSIAGDGSDLKRLKALTDRLNLDKYISFLGSVTHQERQYLYENTDLFVLPNRLDKKNHSVEGLCIAAIEAQLSGLPVLSGQSGGIIEIVKDEVTGFTCNGNNIEHVYIRLTEVLQNKMKMKNVSIFAQQFAKKKFSINNMIKEYIKLL